MLRAGLIVCLVVLSALESDSQISIAMPIVMLVVNAPAR